MLAKKGSVLFYHENGFIAETIRRQTNGLFSHVEICIEDNIAIQIRPGLIIPHKSGICLIDLTFKERHLEKGEYITVKMPVWGDMEAGLYKARELYEQVKSYSLGNITAWWSGIERLRAEHNKDYESDEFLICSETCHKSLFGGLVKYFGIIQEASFTSPNDNFRDFEWRE